MLDVFNQTLFTKKEQKLFDKNTPNSAHYKQSTSEVINVSAGHIAPLRLTHITDVRSHWPCPTFVAHAKPPSLQREKTTWKCNIIALAPTSNKERIIELPLKRSGTVIATSGTEYKHTHIWFIATFKVQLK